MDYAVCQISGRQYIVKPGATIEVDKIVGDKFTIDTVLMVVNGDKIELGDPYLKTNLDFEVVEQKREKIRVSKYKAKSNYRRSHGTVKQTTRVRLIDKKSEKVVSKKEVVE